MMEPMCTEGDVYITFNVNILRAELPNTTQTITTQLLEDSLLFLLQLISIKVSLIRHNIFMLNLLHLESLNHPVNVCTEFVIDNVEVFSLLTCDLKMLNSTFMLSAHE